MKSAVKSAAVYTLALFNNEETPAYYAVNIQSVLIKDNNICIVAYLYAALGVEAEGISRITGSVAYSLAYGYAVKTGCLYNALVQELQRESLDLLYAEECAYAVSVGAECYLAHIAALISEHLYSLSISEASLMLRRAESSGEVYIAALFNPGRSLSHKLLITVKVERTNVLHRSNLKNLVERSCPGRSIAEVEVNNAVLACQSAADVYFGNKLLEIFYGSLAGTHIGNSRLADTDELRNKEHVVSDIAGNGSRRHTESAELNVYVKASLLERTAFADEMDRSTAYIVNSEAADNSSCTAEESFACLKLRSTGAVSGAAAATEHMNVSIDEAWGQIVFISFYNLGIKHRAVNVLAYHSNLVSGNKNILNAEILRSYNMSIFNELKMLLLSFACYVCVNVINIHFKMLPFYIFKALD